MPATFLQAVGQQGMSFEPAEPFAETVPPADALARIRRMQDPPPFVHQPPLGQPIFGSVSCVEHTRCQEGGFPNGIWVFQFPSAGPEDPVSWVAADGTAGGLWLSSDRPPPKTSTAAWGAVCERGVGATGFEPATSRTPFRSAWPSFGTVHLDVLRRAADTDDEGLQIGILAGRFAVDRLGRNDEEVAGARDDALGAIRAEVDRQ